jgi:uncharacterized protein YjeT (DUF2065 family)
MGLNWSDLLAALGLCLVIEGILPFVDPNAVRRAFARLLTLDNRVMRVVGGLSMGVGLSLVFLARG